MNTKSSLTINSLQEILELENDRNILDFRCPATDYLVWPLIRNAFLRLIIGDVFYDEPYVSLSRPKRGCLFYRTLIRGLLHNLFSQNYTQSDILIYATGSHVLKKNSFFNRLADDFCFAAPQKTLLIESLPLDYSWPSSRFNKRFFSDVTILLNQHFAREFSVKSGQKQAALRTAKKTVDYFQEKAHSLFGWDLEEKRKNYLIESLARKIAVIPSQQRIYKKLFQKTHSKLFIREEGCYGGSFILNNIANEYGLITAEYQHGIVHEGHDAYNYSETLRASPAMRNGLPRYFLGYGKWWHELINVPTKKVIIGSPFRSSCVALFKQSSQPKDLLFLGHGLDTDKYLALCKQLQLPLEGNYRIVFRPHPMERYKFEQTKAFDGIRIEWDKDLYKALESVAILVSETSTGLFEAIGLTDRIFLWKTPIANFCFPNHPFATFDNADDLIAKIRDGESGRVDASTVEDFWAPNWKQNYLTFLESVCPGILN